MNVQKAFLVLPAVALVLAASAPAQCTGGTGTLTATPDGPVAAGDTISIEACGSTGSIAFLAVSETAGSTTFGGIGPIPSFTLCLAQPLIVLPLGFTGAGGCAGFELTLPAGVPLPGDLTLNLQGILFGFSFTPPAPPTFSIDTTNTDTLSL